MTETPYIHLVPKDFQKNIEWRMDFLKYGAESRKNAEELWIMCSRDVLFYINSAIFTFSPSDNVDEPVIPFITYDYQDEALIYLNDSIGVHDAIIKKAREMGASWTCLALFEWRWHFKRNQSFLLASRDESYVDASGNDKTLFAKIDFMLANQPGWLKPRFERTRLRLENLDTLSKINGESATGALGRGDRRTSIFWDEVAAWDRGDGLRALASTSAVTKSRIVNSTVGPPGDVFHTLCMKSKHVLEMPWSSHPEKRKGMYKSAGGKVEIIDKAYKFPANYQFINDGKLRSVYYDKFCEDNPIPSLIARELDMDFGGAGGQFFDQEMLKRIKDKYCVPPVWIGDLNYDEYGRPTSLVPNANGTLKLWINLPNDRPRRDAKFTIGVDISLGTGASNSAASIADPETGDKIGECACKTKRPEEWARQVVALSRLFNEAFLIWEANGPGHPFCAVVLELGYRNIFFKTDEKKFPPVRSDSPGFWTTESTKETLLTNYHIALAKGQFINRSLEAISECSEIMRLDDGSIGHQKAQDNLNPAAGGDNHGDLCIADALAFKGCRERPVDVRAEDSPLPYYCMEARRQRQSDEEIIDSDTNF